MGAVVAEVSWETEVVTDVDVDAVIDGAAVLLTVVVAVVVVTVAESTLGRLASRDLDGCCPFGSVRKEH